MTGSRNIGVYICTGCGISESLDPSKLSPVATAYGEVRLCRMHPSLCNPETSRSIRAEITEKQLDALVIAGCSPRHNPETLRFGDILTERVNLREGVAWVMEPGHEDSQLAAEDYLRMGISRVAACRRPDACLQEETVSGILVLGGGITGIQAALEAARAGYPVVLVEKEGRVGGWLNHWHDIIPASGSRETNLGHFLDEKLEELEASGLITLYLNSTVSSISGEPGNFGVSIRKEGRDIAIRIGSVILANGWRPYDARLLEHLGFSSHVNMITQADLEAMAKNDAIVRPTDGIAPENILFLQCAGSRDEKHLPYCSAVCCLTSLKQALYLRRKYPACKVFIVYRDIRTPGRNEHFYREVQEDSRIFLIKGEVAEVREAGNGDLDITIADNLIGEPVSIRAELVVAATGMEPNSPDDLNLLYRKGKGLPERKYGFPDSHFICFPYESQRTGIYAAGAVRAPQGIQDCMEDAAGAVVKAIQCTVSVRKGVAVHPRSGDSSYPVLDLLRCTDCKRCTEECPFGTYDATEKGTPLPNPARCRRCGICMGSCPERIINFDDYSVPAVSAMIRSVAVPREPGMTRVLAFVCENDALPAFDLAALHRHRISPWLRIIPVRCIGSINRVWISDALSAGFDGVMQIGCKPGEDTQCHYITGSELMETRSQNLRETLQTMMLEEERIETVFLEIDEYHRIPGIIGDYIEKIRSIGPNPYRGI